MSTTTPSCDVFEEAPAFGPVAERHTELDEFPSANLHVSIYSHESVAELDNQGASMDYQTSSGGASRMPSTNTDYARASWSYDGDTPAFGIPRVGDSCWETRTMSTYKSVLEFGRASYTTPSSHPLPSLHLLVLVMSSPRPLVVVAGIGSGAGQHKFCMFPNTHNNLIDCKGTGGSTA